MCSALQTRTYNRSQSFSNSCLRKSESHSQAGSATYNLCISDLCRINISNPALQSQKLRENLQKPSAWSHVSRGSHITPCTLFLLPFTFVPATGRFPKKVHDLHHWSQYPFVFGLIHTHRVLFDLLDFRRYLSSRSPSPSLDGGPDLFYQRLDNSKWTMLDIRCTTWKLLDKKHMWWSSVWPVWQSVWPVWSVWSVWISETSVTSDTSSVFSGRQRSQIRENWQGWEGLWGEVFICSIRIKSGAFLFPGSFLSDSFQVAWKGHGRDKTKRCK